MNHPLLRSPRSRPALLLLALGALLLFGALAYLLVNALAGSDLVDFAEDPAAVRAKDALLPTLLALLGGLCALTGAVLLGRAGEKVELDEEKSRRTRAEAERKVEREWNRQLRHEVLERNAAGGPLGASGDVRELVLRLALSLLDAQKGLLLRRSDGETEVTGLEVTKALGFEHDPRSSRLVRQLGSRALRRDETMRMNGVEDKDPTPADEEIDSLVAIPIYVREQFSGVVVLANAPHGFDEHDDDLLLSLGDHAGTVLENHRLQGEVRSAYLGTVRMLADLVGTKDRELGAHSDQVAEYATAVAGRLGLDGPRRETLMFGALLHDVGKVGVSERILLKPAALTVEERNAVELHPVIGSRIVEQVPALHDIVGTILHHHERWDGRGYPEGLAGEDIPLEARIVSVLDSFSAMIADRPYRQAMSVADACAELERCAGSQFDPDVVRAFVAEVDVRPPRGRPEHPLGTREAGSPSREGPLLGTASYGMTDGLTLLFSHSYLHTAAEAEAKRGELQGRPFAVVMAELAHLDELNRRSGYAAGDTALQAAARAVQDIAGTCEGTAAREGGARLALLAPGADAVVGEQLARRVGSRLGEEAEVRCAVAAWEPGDSGEDVIARARASLAATA